VATCDELALEEDDEESPPGTAVDPPPPPPATEVTQEEEGGEEVTRFVKFTFTQEVIVRVPPNTDPRNVRFRDEEGITTAHVVDDHQKKVSEIDQGDVSTRYGDLISPDSTEGDEVLAEDGVPDYLIRDPEEGW
jgi:hypothetical protein